MVTVLSDQHKVRFDGSTDLKHWTHLSEFGPAGGTDGLWECPDLFPLPVEGEPESTKWVLKLDALKGTGAQYFIGDFDGRRFTNDAAPDVVRRVDYGNDFYAAQSWSDEPRGRRIWIAWMNNWHYANDIPTSPWRGLFSIPRQLSLRRFREGLRLVQEPLESLVRFSKSNYYAENAELADANTQLAALELDIAVEIRVQFEFGTASEFGLRLCIGEQEETVIGCNVRSRELFVDRRRAGESSFSEQFAAVHRAPLAAEGGKISLHIFLDSCSIEVFPNGGSTVISDLIFPQSQILRLAFYAHEGEVRLNTLSIRNLT
jgi:fructan beta-fructosidase